MSKRLAACLCALALMLPSVALAEKVVYLTFDDGPKKDTPELLALLDELDVPATFFFMGLSVRAFPEHAKMVVEAGYPVGCHTMGHSPGRMREYGEHYVRRDIGRFMEEMRTLVDENFTTDLYRFPGGSSSYPARLKKAVTQEGLAWFDWNAMTGDTLPGMTEEKIFDYVVKTAAKEEVVILLAHEGKPRTRAALPAIVAHFRERGFEFRALTTAERETLARCPAMMRLPEAAEN